MTGGLGAKGTKAMLGSWTKLALPQILATLDGGFSPSD